MKQVSKQEKDWLIKNNILKMERGKYQDLSLIGRCKKSRRKKYFVPDWMADKARLMMFKKEMEK